MEGRTPDELFAIGQGFFADGEEWEASQWYEAAAYKGHANAALALARFVDNCSFGDGSEETSRHIVELYERAIDLGQPNAGIFLGGHYLEHLSDEEEPTDEDRDLAEKALAAYRRAEDLGNREAYYYIASLYEMGILDNPANMFSGTSYLKGAEAGSYGCWMGLYQMAQMYGWKYVGKTKEEVESKLKELSPYSPEEGS